MKIKRDLIFLPVLFYLTIFTSIFATEISWSDNLKTCITGKYQSLCNKRLLSAQQLTQVENAQKIFRKNHLPSTPSSGSGTIPYPHTSKDYSLMSSVGTYNMDMGGGDMMNLTTGEYIMNMGGGDMMNLTTGDYIMDMGGGDMMNLGTGDYIMDMGGGDKMNLGTGDYIMNMGGGDMMNLTTGEFILGFD